MKQFTIFRYAATASVLAVLVLACRDRTIPVSSANTPSRDSLSLLQVEPPPAKTFKNQWTPELEKEFQQRAKEVIKYYAGKKYGSTYGENEKASYPNAMFDLLAGNREKAIAFLEGEDNQSKDNAHTEGIDYYYSFTLKGQIRKYFFFGKFLDPAYRQRMFLGAKKWTRQDPNGRPHPIYGKGRGGDGWGPEVRGSWVDGRNTDNLRAMRETSVYLMAEETGNEDVRQLYKKRIQRYVWALYHIGMGEWDSENYHGHTLAAYLNLYDFAKDPEVKMLGKAALDWLCTAGALKYYHGGFGGPSKRDYGNSNVVYGSSAARLLWLYFGDNSLPNPKPERDSIHVVTSSYRPPFAIVALARKQFKKPIELLSTKPVYENWKPGGEDKPGYWETTFIGNTYQLGSVVAAFSDGDVGTFKLMAENSQRGVDYFVANTGGDRLTPGKNKGDQIGQYRNLLIWLRPASKQPFYFQIPKTAVSEIEDGIWFFKFEKTWLAVHPINLNNHTKITIKGKKLEELYRDEVMLKATPKENQYAGFTLEVGDKTTSSYASFKDAVKKKSKLDLSQIAVGTVQLKGVNGDNLKITHNSQNELPTIVRNGVNYDWFENYALYKATEGNSPISLGWKQGKLRVEAGGLVFEETVSSDGKVSF
ncbi:hypothetical protein H6F61_27710 [Cyanobacteria bacterium FACHB-472]|nr:hypothetical protein [Cyanobacteria bacterium FACHB-472]